MKVFTLDAFTSTTGGGNPAGVVLDTEGLSDLEMKEIAREVGFSETAFVFPSNLADFKVRFFTPTEEVPLCGHATIATFKLLLLQNQINSQNLFQETLAGTLKIKVSEEGIIWMEQALPKFLGTVSKEELAPSLGLTPEDMVDSLPIEIVSTGLSDIIIPVKSLEILKNFQPNFPMISELSKNHHAIGYHVFCGETLYGNTCACRNLAPLVGIDEEAATGTSNGALSAYLYKHQLIHDANCSYLCFEQGHFMNRPSYILGALGAKQGKIQSVYVGGDAIITGEIHL